MHPHQTVYEMAEEVLERQTKALAARSGQTLEDAMERVVHTDAGRRLRALAEGEHRDEGAAQWQDSLRWTRAEERRYSWVEGYIERLEGKEARARYYALLEDEPADHRGYPETSPSRNRCSPHRRLLS